MLSWFSFSYSCSVSWCYYLVRNVVMIFPFHIHVQCLDAIILLVMLSWLSFSYSCSVSWCYDLVSNLVMTFFFIFMFSVLMLLYIYTRSTKSRDYIGRSFIFIFYIYIYRLGINSRHQVPFFESLVWLKKWY